MTDEHGTGPIPEPTPPPGMRGEHDDASVLEGAGDFTAGEGLVSFAGMVLVAAWLIFVLIVQEYAFSEVIVVLATAAILLPRVDPAKVERYHPLPLLMKTIGYLLVGFGVLELLVDLRVGVFDDVGTILGAVITYAGYVMAFVGARQIQV